MLLDCYEFGRQLLDAGDLDPVYVLVHNADLGNDDPDTPLLHKWLVAYWCFYHVGTASWITEQGRYDERKYWDAMRKAAGSKDYPRSSERRHFRGANADKSVKYLSGRGVHDLFNDLIADTEPTTAKYIIEHVKRWVGFGPWIAFKVADMIERLGIRPIEFDTDTILYDSPREAAELLAKEEGYAGLAGPWAIDRILEELNPISAPPRFERELNAQEAETILCKWKSYRNGHYHIGEDVAACRNGLLKFSGPLSNLSKHLLDVGKKFLW